MSFKSWLCDKIYNFLHVKDNSNGRGFVDRSGEITIRSNSAAENIEEKSINLSSTEWISLRRMRATEDKIDCYDFLREVRCNGIVAFVPYRYNTDSRNFQVLLRYEATPCWDYTKQVPSSFTGGVEEGETPLQTVMHELKEEAGYIVDRDRIINLGQVFGSKSSDTIYFLFGINLTNLGPEQNLTSESELEKTSYNQWIDFNTIGELVPDGIFNCVCFRLQNYLSGRI